jgi:hypothetical protein
MTTRYALFAAAAVAAILVLQAGSAQALTLTECSGDQLEGRPWLARPFSLPNRHKRLPVVVAHDITRGFFFNGPRRREAAWGHGMPLRQ